MFMNTVGAYNLRYGGLGSSTDEDGLNSNVVAIEWTPHGLSLRAGTQYQNRNFCIRHPRHAIFLEFLNSTTCMQLAFIQVFKTTSSTVHQAEMPDVQTNQQC